MIFHDFPIQSPAHAEGEIEERLKKKRRKKEKKKRETTRVRCSFASPLLFESKKTSPLTFFRPSRNSLSSQPSTF